MAVNEQSDGLWAMDYIRRLLGGQSINEKAVDYEMGAMLTPKRERCLYSLLYVSQITFCLLQ